MAAPGDSLEFDESDWFVDQTGDSREFKERVLDHIRNRPGSRTPYIGGLDYYLVTFDHSQYRVITRRVRNDIHLVYVFEWPGGKEHFEILKSYLVAEYGDDGWKHRRRKR